LAYPLLYAGPARLYVEDYIWLPTTTVFGSCIFLNGDGNILQLLNSLLLSIKFVFGIKAA